MGSGCNTFALAQKYRQQVRARPCHVSDELLWLAPRWKPLEVARSSAIDEEVQTDWIWKEYDEMSPPPLTLTQTPRPDVRESRDGRILFVDEHSDCGSMYEVIDEGSGESPEDYDSGGHSIRLDFSSGREIEVRIDLTTPNGHGSMKIRQPTLLERCLAIDESFASPPEPPFAAVVPLGETNGEDPSSPRRFGVVPIEPFVEIEI